MDREPSPYDNLFENIRRDVDPVKLKQAARRVGILAAVVVLLILGYASLVPSTEYLWFLHDARHPEVFLRAYQVRSLLFAVSFVVAWLFLYLNVRMAFKQTMIFLETPSSRGQALVTNALDFVQKRGAILVRWIAPVLAFFSALDFSNEWSTFLLAQHAQAFGKTDPTYHLDLGFYVFSLPWYRAVSNFACALLLLTTLSTIGIYAGLQAMAALAKIELGRPRVRAHVHALIGVTILAYALQTFLKTYEAGLVPSEQFTGAGFAAMQGLMVQRFVVLLGVLVGIGCIANGWTWRPYAVPIRGIAVVAIVYVLGVLVYPSVVQKVYVDPDRIERETPFARSAIEMTRFGYGLDNVEVRTETPTSAPTSDQIATSQGTFSNMRLWDPDVLKQCLEGYQAIRPYYRFFDVDVDRYMVDGKKTLLMLSPRQIDLSGLQQNARNWTNERLQYTHGYGLVVARVDQETPDGEPVMLDKDVPEISTPDLKVTEPRIYYGDTRESGQDLDEYAIVDTGQSEFDYPQADTSVITRWTGTGGIPIGAFLPKLAFSMVLGDGNLLVSPEIKSTSRLLMHRGVLDRATRIYPFLEFDNDPYIVILNGHLLWMLDGYTTSDMLPYSDMSSDGSRVNYIRNSVKVTVDAYTGATTAYVVDPADPVLKAWMSVYPGLVRPVSEAPSGLDAHFRYPEDLLDLQSAQMCTYHVTDPRTFLGNGDAWNIAAQRGLSGEKEPIKPFYVELNLPGEAGTSFVQILPFTPNGRVNMSGWLAAQCDPGRYGRLTLYTLNQSVTTPGPESMESTFVSTPDISYINRQYSNQQSSIITGNLLVVPVGSTFMFAESYFLRSNTTGLQSVPKLIKVILAIGPKVVVKDTYPEALQALLGAEQPAEEAQAPATTAAPPSPTGPKTIATVVKQAVNLLDQADQALRKGDFATYGKLQKQARDELRGTLR